MWTNAQPRTRPRSIFYNKFKGLIGNSITWGFSSKVIGWILFQDGGCRKQEHGNGFISQIKSIALFDLNLLYFYVLLCAISKQTISPFCSFLCWKPLLLSTAERTIGYSFPSISGKKNLAHSEWGWILSANQNFWWDDFIGWQLKLTAISRPGFVD